ncbi:MAG: methyl-accepting chemotaxis protein [Treponema sp.]|nr:methyl-accepting chemotaxis protein [Treponema sp.]
MDYSSNRLHRVIEVEEENCYNCYACLTECPVKFCMDGSGDKLVINDDLCIGCGHCVVICPHKARHVVDSLGALRSDLLRGEKVVAIVAPAVVSVFPNNYLRLNAFLKSQGIEAVFDVSFGGELTVMSYVNFIKTKKPRLVIAQPCPAIVSYIEIYHPELIPYLAPVDSPMLHTIKMIKEFYPQYRNHKVAVISPCVAKEREFAETGLGDYNITMSHMKEIFADENIDLGTFPVTQYDGPAAERGVMFPIPGGLMDVAERFMPGIRRNTRKIESLHLVYKYLTELAKDIGNTKLKLPFLIDCLNCEDGCAGGPGTGNSSRTMDQLESPIRKRSEELEKQLNPKGQERLYKKYHELIGQYWRTGLYNRNYHDRSNHFNIKIPTEVELTELYRSMKKETKRDILDCRACGYRTCEEMAIAIHNRINKRDNCIQYTSMLLGEEKKTTVYINQQLKIHIGRALELIEAITELVEKLSSSINTQANAVDESSEVTGLMVDSINKTADLSRQERETVMGMVDNVSKGQDSMKETIQSVKNISESVDGIASTIKIISAIASNTNLLAMNAAIEAAHAGEAGRGFAVVADEIRRLSESTRQNSRGISQTLSNIIAGINSTSKRTGDTGNLINQMSGEVNGFAGTMTELIDTLNELSTKSSRITNSLNNLKDHSATVKVDYTEMLSLIDKLRYDINFLAAMSADIVRAIEEGDQEIITRLVALENEAETKSGKHSR